MDTTPTRRPIPTWLVGVGTLAGLGILNLGIPALVGAVTALFS